MAVRVAERRGADRRRAAGVLGVRQLVGTLWSPKSDIRDHLQALGYHVAAEPTADALWVSTNRNAGIDAHVRQGGRLVLLPNSEFELSPLFPHWQDVKIRERAETLWQGDRASTFGWLDRHLAFFR